MARYSPTLPQSKHMSVSKTFKPLLTSLPLSVKSVMDIPSSLKRTEVTVFCSKMVGLSGVGRSAPADVIMMSGF